MKPRAGVARTSNELVGGRRWERIPKIELLNHHAAGMDVGNSTLDTCIQLLKPLACKGGGKARRGQRFSPTDKPQITRAIVNGSSPVFKHKPIQYSVESLSSECCLGVDSGPISTRLRPGLFAHFSGNRNRGQIAGSHSDSREGWGGGIRCSQLAVSCCVPTSNTEHESNIQTEPLFSLLCPFHPSFVLSSHSFSIHFCAK
jgi:hypothetical protein